MRVFTGAIVPREFEAVVKREETQELDGSLTLMDSARRTEAGTNIRRAGENARCGSMVLPPHTLITGATRASMANFGCRKIDLFSRVRLSLVTTGNEVGEYDDQLPMPWQLRDSNRASILTLLNAIPWIRIVRTEHSRDDQESLVGMLRSCVSDSDAIVLTGGVSMGDYDFVPAALRAIGGEVVFHGLPIRPGKPILGAATIDGKLLVGLPGNPVSALVCCQRMVIPLLRRVAGIEPWMPQRPLVYLGQPDEQKILLHWMRLVRLVDQGVAELVDSHGSGDLVSLGRSTGFIELPPGSSGIGPWPYTAWD
jgi:molybdenum cofactor synthesis domain-containing protein